MVKLKPKECLLSMIWKNKSFYYFHLFCVYSLQARDERVRYGKDHGYSNIFRNVLIYHLQQLLLLVLFPLLYVEIVFLAQVIIKVNLPYFTHRG